MAAVTSGLPETTISQGMVSEQERDPSLKQQVAESSGSQIKVEGKNYNLDLEDEVPTVGTDETQTASVKVNPREEWIDKEKPTYCKVCDFQAPTTEVYQIHNITVRHVKKVIEVFNLKLPYKEEKKEVKKEVNMFHCQVCLISCNSESAWNSHLIGQKHRKALEKQGAEKAQQKLNSKAAMSYGYQYSGGMRGGRGGGPMRGGHYGQGHRQKPYEKPMHSVQQPSNSGYGPLGAMDFAQYGEPLIGLEYVTEIQVVGQSPRYHCELCDSKFDHNLKFPHLVGAKHRLNVLKEKNPQVAQEIRVGVKKRSELTARLLEEAQKLEDIEGRKEVKTRVEKSPFSRVNSMGNNNTPMQSLMGASSYSGQNQRGRGNAGMRGAQGGGQMRGNAASRGSSARGGQGRGGMNNQSARGTRGRGGNQFTGRGGRGQGRQQQITQDNTPNQPFATSGGYSSSSTYSDSGEHLLPKEALRPRSPPRTTKVDPYYSSFDQTDLDYDTYYGGNTYSSSTSDRYGGYTQYSSNSYSQQQLPPPSSGPAESYSAVSTQGTDKIMGNLKGALGDLSKLVNSEEDASMALQVSNALTQALLSFRIQNMAEGGTGGVAGESSVGQHAVNPGGSS